MNTQQAVLAVIFAGLIGLGAQLSIPLPGVPLPITLQSVAVLVAGAVLGANAAGMCIVIYLLMGVVGLPVFANGGSGGATLFGPSGGYLLGFWFAAVLLGYASDRGWLWRVPLLLPVWMLAGHVLILLVGAGLLSFSLGATAAWFNGVVPFLPGGVAKSILAGVLSYVLYKVIRERADRRKAGGQHGQIAEQDR